MRYRYCHLASGALSGIKPTNQANKPLKTDEKYAKQTMIESQLSIVVEPSVKRLLTGVSLGLLFSFVEIHYQHCDARSDSRLNEPQKAS